MARKVQETRVLGRSQAGRPAPPHEAHRQADSERTLIGALSVPIEQIVPDPGQPRSATDPERLKELAASIAAEGLLQPLVVREEGFLGDGRTRYVVVAGARRYAAAQHAGLTRVPVLVRESQGASLRVLQLTENLHREDLSEADEGRAYQELMDLENLSPRGVAERLHISDQHVRDRLRLAADQVLADAVARGQIAASTAREILKQPDTLREELRARVARGEHMQGSELSRAREQLRAAGQPPPRRNPGSGRKPAPQTVFEKLPRPTPDAVPPPTPVSLGPEQNTAALDVGTAAGDQPGHAGTDQAPDIMEAQSPATAHAQNDAADLARAGGIAGPMRSDGASPGAMSGLPERGAASASEADLRSDSRVPDTHAHDAGTLSGLVAASGGAPAVLQLLHWAIEHDLSLDQLIEAVMTLPSAHER